MIPPPAPGPARWRQQRFDHRPCGVRYLPVPHDQSNARMIGKTLPGGRPAARRADGRGSAAGHGVRLARAGERRQPHRGLGRHRRRQRLLRPDCVTVSWGTGADCLGSRSPPRSGWPRPWRDWGIRCAPVTSCSPVRSARWPSPPRATRSSRTSRDSARWPRCSRPPPWTVSGRRSDNPARPERPVEAVGGREGAERRTEPRCGGPQWPCGCSGRQPVTGRRPGGEPIGGPGGTHGAAAGRAGQSLSDSQVGAALRTQHTRRPVHGERDQVTRPRAPADYVQWARTAGARAGMILIRNGDHAMLRRSSLWHRTVATAVTGLLHPDAPPCALTTASYAATDPLLL